MNDLTKLTKIQNAVKIQKINGGIICRKIN